MVAGIVFVKIKRCPCCHGCNSDENPIPGGSLFGILVCAFLPWGRGTSQNPEGRLCRICLITWTEGGFYAQFADIDNFLAEREKQAQVNDEWEGAREVAIEFLSAPDAPSTRMGKLVRAGLCSKMNTARAQVIEVYNDSSIRVGCKYRGVDAAWYEKKFPGRIARKGWTVKIENTCWRQTLCPCSQIWQA